MIRLVDGARTAAGAQILCRRKVEERHGECRDKGGDEQRATGPLSDREQRHAPHGVSEEHVETEQRVRRQSEEREHGEPPQVEPGEGAAQRFRPPQLNREARAKQQRERAVRLALDQAPDQRADDIVQPAWLGRVIVEMDDEHPEQREAAKDVERSDPSVRDHCSAAGSGCRTSEVCSTAWPDPLWPDIFSQRGCWRPVSRSPAPPSNLPRPPSPIGSRFRRPTTACRARDQSAATTGSRALWRERRSAWATERAQGSGRRGLPRRLDHAGLGRGPRAAFPGVKIANRGISGDTTRGVLIRLHDDVLALNPAAVVLLIGTNDLEEGATPEIIAGNLTLILAELKRHNPRMPVILCQVFPSSATMKRPADQIKAVNALYLAAVKNDAQVIPLDTWRLFADANGDAPASEFPDLLHPNAAGYAKWAAALRPLFATLRLMETTPDAFTPEEGFESLFNGRDLTGWGYRPTTDADKESAKKWQASDPNAPPWPIVTEPVAFDGRTSSPDGRFVAINGRLVVTTPPEGRKIQQLYTTREFGDDFVLQARVPRDAQRRQRRLRARAAAAVPRLRARRPLQGAEELQAAGLERAGRHGAERRGTRDQQRRGARRRAQGPGDGPDRRRGRPRADGVPAHPHQTELRASASSRTSASARRTTASPA